MLDELGKKYIFGEYNALKFLVGGKEIHYGHFGKVINNDNLFENVTVENNNIHFCVQYISRSMNQCATIPNADKNWELFHKIIKSQNGIIIAFSTNEGKGIIYGIGTMYGMDENGKNMWLFWDV